MTLNEMPEIIRKDDTAEKKLHENGSIGGRESNRLQVVAFLVR